ncbi:MAG: extracellular solute-binding protein, partial [Pseudomonadota bacterium]
MRKQILAVVVGGLCALLAGGLAAEAQTRTRLTVYSTLELEQLEPYRRSFEADNPDIEIALIRDSTGVLTGRLLAEKDNPRGDAIWGLAVTSMLLLDAEGLLLPYAPKDLDGIKPSFRDPRDPPRWVGMDAWVAAICFNTVEAARRRLPAPKSWKDLLDPVYKGHIVMPNPASSGTGFFTVSMWVQTFGEAEAWRYMDKLHENIAFYVHSGAKPCRLAAAGEFALGVSYDLAGASARPQGAPIGPRNIEEGGGWVNAAAAHRRVPPQLDSA